MSEISESEPKHLEIRKYPNRRYYDATRSRHLTLDELHSVIREGYDIRVTDSKTGVDITAQVLTQIILELETQKLDSFPVPLLARVIRVNDRLVKDFIDKYFNQALHSFLQYQHQLEEQLRQVHGLPPVYPAVTAWTKAMLQPFASAFGQPASSTQSPAPSAQAQEAEQLRQMVKDLQEQVVVLKKHRGKKSPRSPRQKKVRIQG